MLTNDALARLKDAAIRPDLSGDRYELKELIGRGGMGAVYVAHDRLLGRDIALKVANTIVGGPADGLMGVEPESRILARLEHPGIVPVHDAGHTADGRPFYAMKLVRGDTLAEHLARVTDLSRRLSIFERAVDAVAFAHAAGVLHRDLSARNIMIGSFGEVLVLDWGVAQLLAERGDRDELRVGTPGFIAPERQAPRAAQATPASDVYALGVVLSLMLDGMNAPKRLRAIAAKCQAADPRDRYVDASALADDLAKFRAGHPVSAYRDTIADRAAAWLNRYGVFVALILAYLAMRAAVAMLTAR